MIWRSRLESARSGTLGTIATTGPSSAAGAVPHLVPCCFVLVGETVHSAVDAKPKSTMALLRLDNIRANPVASLLVDHFDDDWTTLWWVRVDGTARVIEDGAERDVAIDHLVAKYPQYQAERPAGAVIAIDIHTWRHWAARP